MSKSNEIKIKLLNAPEVLKAAGYHQHNGGRGWVKRVPFKGERFHAYIRKSDPELVIIHYDRTVEDEDAVFHKALMIVGPMIKIFRKEFARLTYINSLPRPIRKRDLMGCG